ncbi:hypothetical protein HY479_02735 [Candidatus Uhrbacteria bacterium]|nr:hypothetical protein [Candidatus Uhrbacteria bacterium]
MKSVLVAVLTVGLGFAPFCPFMATAAMRSETVEAPKHMSMAERLHDTSHSCCRNHGVERSDVSERKSFGFRTVHTQPSNHPVQLHTAFLMKPAPHRSNHSQRITQKFEHRSPVKRE